MTSPEQLACHLARARARTLRLVDFDDAELCCQYDPLMSPLVWDLAHIGQQEELWLLRGGDPGQPGLLPPAVEGLYDAFEHSRASRVELPLLSPARARSYCATVRSAALDALAALPEDGDSFVFAMVISHENQHDETMLQALNLRTGSPLLAATSALPAGRPRMAGTSVLVAGGPFVLGVDAADEPCSLDNERPAHVVDVPAFRIGRVPVTNGEWQDFIDDGGYTQSRWWSERGWQHRQRAGLTAPQFWRSGGRTPPKWFYDTVGSELFDQITRLPEYYPTRAEAEILRARSAEVASACRADTLVELGSGTSEKTRMLLDALRHRGSLRRFVPFDVDASVLSATATAIQREYSGVEINAVCGDFEEHLTEIPRGGRRLFVFLGSTIGNLTPGPRAQFLTALAGVMRPGDSLLLGTDLVKDAARLVRAYDDPGGVTAQFNRNVLAVINRELEADFDVDAFQHVARWNSAEERIEMWLRADGRQRVRVGALDLTVDFDAGEEMLTEVSCKFRPQAVGAELAAAGLHRIRWWTDEAGDFGLSLAAK